VAKTAVLLILALAGLLLLAYFIDSHAKTVVPSSQVTPTLEGSKE